MQVTASEIYWERRGAGIKQMAQNYLAQKKDGQLAAAPALEFLYQLGALTAWLDVLLRRTMTQVLRCG